jgi:PAS domain S-box-containing protein
VRAVVDTLHAGPSAALLAALLDDAEDPLLAFDAAAVLVCCNRAATRLLGCAPGQDARQALAVLGPEAVRWIGAQPAGETPRAPTLALSLPGGRPLRLALRAAAGGWTLRLQPGVAAPVPAPALRRSGAATTVAPSAAPALLNTLWQSALPALLLDARRRVLNANDAYCRATGHARATSIGGDAPALPPAAETLRLVDAAGRVRHFHVTELPLALDGGSPALLQVLQDRSGEQQAREEADRSLEELSQWFDLSPTGMLVYGAGGRVLRSNPAFAALAGDVPVQLQEAGAGLRALLGWDGHAPQVALRPGAPPLERRAVVPLAGGRLRHLGARLSAFTTGQGQQRVMAVVEDRSAEDERDLARHEMGALMDAAGIGVATLDSEYGWLQPPPRSGGDAAAAGAGRAGGLQGISREIVEPSSLAEYERLQQALRRGERAEARYAVRHPELGPRWLLTRVEPAALGGGRTATSVVTLDVTDQELARRRNEQLLRELETILDGSPAGIASLRGGALVRCNQHFERLLGLPPGSAQGVMLEDLLGREAQGRSVARQAAEALQAGRPFEAELSWPRQAAAETWYSLSVRPADAAGATVGAEAAAAAAGDAAEAVAVLTDITRLKAQQRDLEALLREREMMFSLSDVGIVYRRGGHIERANQAMAELTGHAAPQLAALDESALYESPRDCVEFEARIDHALREHGRFSGERRLRRRDGGLLWVQVAVRPVDAGDGSAGTIASYVDVDERHRARETLQTQAERTRAILDSVLVGIVTVRDGGIEWMNRSARRMFAGELADFAGRPIGTVATPEPGHPLRRTDWLARLDDGRAETFECRLKARDGREFWVAGNAVVTSGDGSGRQLTFALLDIEQRRQAEMRIAQAQQSLQRVIETAPAAIALFDGLSLEPLQSNQMASRDFGLAGVPGDELREALRAAADSGEVLRRELQRAGADGPRTWDVRVVALPPAAAGRAAQRLLVASDVTEQRAAEQARLSSAIAQREALVREVHHRIKNNLQGVAGLLQQNAARHAEVAPVLNEAVGQVQAIAQVYGLQVGSTGPLAVVGVVQAIALSVQRTFGRAVRCELHGEDLADYVLPEAESIPIALTLNELMTNGVKHGSGDVTCTLERLGPGDGGGVAGGAVGEGVSITISHPGGLPTGFSIERVPSGVSGLGLVRALLPRRSATLTISEDGGSVVARVVLREPGVRRGSAA